MKAHKKVIQGLLFSILLIIAGATLVDSAEVTITTYYPAPYGEYQELYVSGNVGIGTTDPLGKLSIDWNSNNNGFTAYGIYHLNTNSAGSPGSTYGIYSRVQMANAGSVNYGLWSEMNVGAAGTAAIYGKITTPATWRYAAIFEGGNVGIGTTNPSEKLTVVDANDETFLGLSGAAGSHTNIAIGRTAGEARLGIAASTGQYAAGSAAGDAILRVDSSTQKLHLLAGTGNAVMTITNSNVGIGTTDPDGLEIDTGVTQALQGRDNIRLGVLAGTPRIIFEDSGVVWQIDNSAGLLRMFLPGSVKFQIASNGNVTGPGGVSYHSSSDIRLKKEIIAIPDALEKVLALRGVNFRWKDSDRDKSLRMGMIAQEVEKIVPELVHTSDDEMQTKTVEYQYVVALLIEAVKEQQAQIKSLTGRIMVLEE